MTFVADENFPRPALEALRNAGWEVFSVAEECPDISDEEVAALCSESQRVLLTFDKDFGELVFRRGLSAGSGVVLFRLIPESVIYLISSCYT
jgi:predicted nuclease of predicted toxin-antitoxin system